MVSLFQLISVQPLTSSLIRLLETVHTIFVIHFVYWYLILNFGNNDEFAKIYWCVLPKL